MSFQSTIAIALISQCPPPEVDYTVGTNYQVNHPHFYRPWSDNTECPEFDCDEGVTDCPDPDEPCERAESYDETCTRCDGEGEWPGVGQNEPYIAISPEIGISGNPDPLQFAVWRDFTLHPDTMQIGLGFAMSDTDLSDWKGCDDCCGTGGLRAGHSISRSDWPTVTESGCLPDDFISALNPMQEKEYVTHTDPSVAIGGPTAASPSVDQPHGASTSADFFKVVRTR